MCVCVTPCASFGTDWRATGPACLRQECALGITWPWELGARLFAAVGSPAQRTDGRLLPAAKDSAVPAFRADSRWRQWGGRWRPLLRNAVARLTERLADTACNGEGDKCVDGDNRASLVGVDTAAGRRGQLI